MNIFDCWTTPVVTLISIISEYFHKFFCLRFFKTGVILPLFKGKGVKSNNKDNYYQEHSWILGNESVDQIYEKKNLGIVKNYIGSFYSNVDKNIEKTRKKAGMIFSSNFCHRKVNPLTYIITYSCKAVLI